MDKAKAILERLDIDITYHGQDYVACSTGYREGNTSTGVLCRDSHVFDVVLGKKMFWEEFVARVKNVNIEAAKKWLAGAKIENGEKEFEEKEERIEQEKSLHEGDYQTIKSYDFFLRRGISKETLDFFGVGLCQSGPMYGRCIVKIRNERGKLIGVAGRDVLGRHEKDGKTQKWKNKAPTSKWIFPNFEKNIQATQKTGQIIIVESLGDTMALFDAGYPNVLCNFGLNLSAERTSFILRLNPKKIIISLNNDSEADENRGQKGAAKIYKKLGAFFSEDKLLNAPPLKNDFGAMSKEEINLWAEKYKVTKL